MSKTTIETEELFQDEVGNLQSVKVGHVEKYRCHNCDFSFTVENDFDDVAMCKICKERVADTDEGICGMCEKIREDCRHDEDVDRAFVEGIEVD